MAGANMIDVTEATFQRAVLDESRSRPVIIDFWATWCGPCRTLGPMLEDLAEQCGGAFLLAKVDVDQNQQLATAARVQSIPTVVAVYDGAFVDQFIGLLPRPELRRFIDSVLERAGATVPEAEPAVPTDPQQAERFWQAKVADDAKDDEALLELGRLYLRMGRSDDARASLEKVQADQDRYDMAQSTLQLIGLFDEVREAGGDEAVRQRSIEDPTDERARYLVACADAGRGELAKALTMFVDLVASAGSDVRESAQAAARTLLAAAGRDDPAIESQRRRLAGLLF